jgi:hypothetical protein
MDVLRQRDWTEAELRAEGYHYYERRKELIMAGRLPPSAAPLKIVYELETRYADAGDVICFEPGSRTRRSLYDYDYWSVKPDIFRQTYRKWDTTDWTPTPPQAHLLSYGCRPYYKSSGVWARQLKQATRVQSIESPIPVRVEAGAWVLIGTQGEPWYNTDQDFHNRYIVPEPARKGWGR